MDMEVGKWIWFNAFIILMLALDLCVFHKKAHVVSVKEALGWSAFWIALALVFNLFIYYIRGPEDALNFLTGYLIEKSLSVDNLFVFLLIFQYFKTPLFLMHKVLFWGVLGAIIFRGIFIIFGITLVQQFHWMIFIMGLFLIYTGFKLCFEKEKEIHPEKNPILNLFRRYIAVTPNYEGVRFMIKKEGKYLATPLFIVLICIEMTDIVFAIDSIPAILAITLDPFIVFTSNIFAILGLRSLYFALSGLLEAFYYLNFGLAIILTFIGIKMVISPVIEIPIVLSLLFILLVLTVTVFISICYPKKTDVV